MKDPFKLIFLFFSISFSQTGNAQKFTDEFKDLLERGFDLKIGSRSTSGFVTRPSDFTLP